MGISRGNRSHLQKYEVFPPAVTGDTHYEKGLDIVLPTWATFEATYDREKFLNT